MKKRDQTRRSKIWVCFKNRISEAEAAQLTGIPDSHIHQVYAEFRKDEKRAFMEKIGARFTENGGVEFLLKAPANPTFVLITNNEEVQKAYIKMITKKPQF